MYQLQKLNGILFTQLINQHEKDIVHHHFYNSRPAQLCL
jgi:hypothetical protein